MTMVTLRRRMWWIVAKDFSAYSEAITARSSVEMQTKYSRSNERWWWNDVLSSSLCGHAITREERRRSRITCNGVPVLFVLTIFFFVLMVAKNTHNTFNDSLYQEGRGGRTTDTSSAEGWYQNLQRVRILVNDISLYKSSWNRALRLELYPRNSKQLNAAKWAKYYM